MNCKLNNKETWQIHLTLTKTVVNFWHHQNYVILITLFSKENFLFDVNAFICLRKIQFLLGKGVTLYKQTQQVNQKKRKIQLRKIKRN